MATSTDPTAGWIDTLDFYAQGVAIDFINDLRTNYRLPAIITSGRRTLAEQQSLLLQGRTTTLQSKHLQGLAFDIDMYGWNRNSVPAWVWQEIGPVGESYGLTWGGRWTSFVDVGHFEI